MSGNIKPHSSGARIVAIGASLAVSILLMAAKFYIYRLTLSAAILSDALESIINVVASAFALISIIMSAKPPDESHPYGHGKIEFFSAGFEGALIMVAAVGIFVSGMAHLIDPREIHNLGSGLLLLLVTALVNLGLGICLVRIGKRTGSLALSADGEHVLSDVYTSGGVLLGLFLVQLTGYLWLDGVIACIVGIRILFTGGKLVRISFGGLMDESDPQLLEEVSKLLAQHRKDHWIDVHQLRVLRSGNLINIDFHMILPRHMTLDQAHGESVELEHIIVRHFSGNARVLIHLDPCLDPECRICQNSECEDRTQAPKDKPAWDSETVSRVKTRHGKQGIS